MAGRHRPLEPGDRPAAFRDIQLRVPRRFRTIRAMRLVRFPWSCCLGWGMLGADEPVPRMAPCYSALSIVNAADNQSGGWLPTPLALSTVSNLAYSTAAIRPNDLHGGVLPTMLIGASDTTVLINDSPSGLILCFADADQFPGSPGSAARAGLQFTSPSTACAGPLIEMTLAPAAPGLFQLDANNAVATLADGSVLTPASPARPGRNRQSLGNRTRPNCAARQWLPIPAAAAPLIDGANLSILLDGMPVSSSAIQYAGVAPGFAGLYQINLKLPTSTSAESGDSLANWTARPAFPACIFRWRRKC